MRATRWIAYASFLSLLASVASVPAAAQSCPNTTDIFHKNDTLPAVPTGPVAVAIPPGLCEGEAIGSVFDIISGGPEDLTQVSIGWGDTFGVGGQSAVLNVEIYDGVSFTGGTPNLGAKIFDLGNDAGFNTQVTSHAINALDMQPYGITVDNANNNFVVVFRVEINPNGNCTTGYTSNPMMDGVSGSCTTIPQRNLIDIQGSGWTDVVSATVTGFPLCPVFLNGNWVARACTAPTNPLFVTANPNTVAPGNFVNLTFTAPGEEGDFYVAAASKGTLPGIFLPHSGTIPLNIDNFFNLSLTSPSVFINFFGVISPAGTAPGIINLPSNPNLVGKDMFIAFITAPAGFTPPWGISSATKIEIR